MGLKEHVEVKKSMVWQGKGVKRMKGYDGWGGRPVQC